MNEEKPRTLLGDILTRLHLVDDDQVRAALEYQQKSGKLFGESLLALEFIGEDDLGWALSSQLSLPFVAVTPEMVDAELVSQYPREFLMSNLVLPLVASDTVLSVVLADPTDHTVRARLERISNLELSVAVGTPSAIREALRSTFPDANGGTGDGETEAPAPGPVSIHSAALGTLLDRALGQGATAVHLDPDGGKVRVRFRNGAGVLTPGGEFDGDSMEELKRGLSSWLGGGHEIVPGVVEWQPPTEATDAPPFHALAITGSRGTSLTLTLGGVTPICAPKEEGNEETWSRVHALLERRRGLVVGVAPEPAGRTHLLNRILDGSEFPHRRSCVLTDEDIPLAKGQIRYGGRTTLETVQAFARMDGMDVVAGVFEGPESLACLAEAAATDRLVLAVFPGNSVLGFLCRMLEAGVSAPLLSECLLAGLAGQDIPGDGDTPSRTVFETLLVEAPLRRALQDGGDVEEMREAARSQGFEEIAVRAGRIESISAEILEDLRRNSYLEDAA